MRKYIVLLGFLLLTNASLLLASEVTIDQKKFIPFIDIEMGLSSYVGGYYYQNNDNKDFEYKSNHNWYLSLSKDINNKISTSAEIRYYPELFDKKLYLYSADVAYHPNSDFEFAWEFDRIGLGQTNQIFRNALNDLRSDQNFITDYRFNGARVKHRLSKNIFLNLRVGGNDLNTGIGEVKLSFNNPNLKIQQSLLLVSRDNRFNAKALDINNLICWDYENFFIQNFFHNSYLDYYRNYTDEKSNVVKDLLETKFNLFNVLEPQFSFYYEAENWDKYKIYETNSILNIKISRRYEIAPAFKFVNYQESIQREYSLLLNYHIHSIWDVGLIAKFIDNPSNQDIISYGLQTKFNLPLNSSQLNSLLN
jgi:hypothetical protein